MAGTRAQSGDRYGSGTLHSRQFLRGRLPLLSPPPLDVPTFASRCLHVQATWETSISERRNYGREMAGQFCLWFRLPRKPRVLWHAAQICDMGYGFTSLPQGRHAVDFFARKIRRLRPGSNPRFWVPEASMLTTRPPNNDSQIPGVRWPWRLNFVR